MTSMRAIHRRPLQFSLRELFVWVTLFAIGLSIFTSRCQSIGLWLVLYALSLRLLWAHLRRIPTGISRRRLFRNAILARRLREPCRLPPA